MKAPVRSKFSSIHVHACIYGQVWSHNRSATVCLVYSDLTVDQMQDVKRESICQKAHNFCNHACQQSRTSNADIKSDSSCKIQLVSGKPCVFLAINHT